MKLFLELDCYVSYVIAHTECYRNSVIEYQEEELEESFDIVDSKIVTQDVEVSKLRSIRETWLDEEDAYACILIFPDGEYLYCSNKKADIIKRIQDNSDVKFVGK